MRSLFTRLFLLLSVAAGFAACSKDKEDIPEGVTCTIDGVETSFNRNAFALKIGSPNAGYQCTIFGTGDSQTAFTITAGGEAAIAPGTYTFSEDQDDIKLGMLSYVTSTYDQFISIPGSPTNPTEVNITAISDDFVEGTFKGEIIGLLTGTATVKSVTNGRFKVRIQQ